MKFSLSVWIVTGRCNLSCRHCYTARFKGELTTEECFRVADKLSRLVHHVGLSGGEPLVREDFFDILEYTAAKAGNVSFQSNLTLLDRVKAERIADLGVFMFTSLDGHTEELYEANRGQGTWSRFLKAINLLLEKNIKFATVTAISRLNWMYVDEIARFAEKIGAEKTCFLPVIPVGRASVNPVSPAKPELLKALKLLDKVSGDLSIPVSIWCTPFVEAVCENLSGGLCIEDSFDVAPDGSILLCDTLDFKISDVSKDETEILRDLRENPVLLEARKIPVECLDCSYSSLCRGGCKARSYHIERSLLKPDPLCPLLEVRKPTGKPA